MRKSTIFVSAVLTTFTLVVLYGVVSAYQKTTLDSTAAAQVVETATPEPTHVPVSTPSMITPEEAAQVAAAVVGNTNLLSAESSSVDGVNAYKITFTNDDVVYVGLDGQVLSVQVAPVVNVVAQAPAKQQKNDSDSNNNSSKKKKSNDDHDDDDHDDDDHDD